MLLLQLRTRLDHKNWQITVLNYRSVKQCGNIAFVVPFGRVWTTKAPIIN